MLDSSGHIRINNQKKPTETTMPKIINNLIAKLRCHWLNLLGIRIASGKVSPHAIIEIIHGGSISIGRRCSIHRGAIIQTYGGAVRIGDNVSINPYSVIYGHGGLTIGNGVRIATHCVVIPANHLFDDLTLPIFKQGESRQGIHIEDDVWIGAGSTILDGVTIG
jgi:acetyltransferase-like isoleucine patch superfamily enzyme